MMKTKIRVLSLIFCIITLLTLLSPSVFAAQKPDSVKLQESTKESIKENITTAETEAADTASQEEKPFLSIENFLATLPVMLYGMLGIFTVILLIFIFIKILVKLFPCKS